MESNGQRGEGTKRRRTGGGCNSKESRGLSSRQSFAIRAPFKCDEHARVCIFSEVWEEARGKGFEDRELYRRAIPNKHRRLA